MREGLRHWIVVVVSALGVVGAAPGVAHADRLPTPEPVWADDQAHLAVFVTEWEETPAHPTAEHFHVTAPQDLAKPQETAAGASGCAHDHVVALRREVFRAELHLLTAVASDRVATRTCTFFGTASELAYAADLDGDPATALQPLTSIAKVGSATEQGLVKPVYEGFSVELMISG